LFAGLGQDRGLRELDVSWNAHAKGGAWSIAEALRTSAIERIVLSQVTTFRRLGLNSMTFDATKTHFINSNTITYSAPA
jgi:hypothetical protein